MAVSGNGLKEIKVAMDLSSDKEERRELISSFVI
jgi:hypothetical protein